MHSVARIAGVQEQLRQLLNTLAEHYPDLSTKINQREELVCELSGTASAEHWADVANRLECIGEAIRTSGVGDFGILVETQFESNLLPGGGVASDTMQVSHIGLEAMARLGADFEIASLRPSQFAKS